MVSKFPLRSSLDRSIYLYNGFMITRNTLRRAPKRLDDSSGQKRLLKAAQALFITRGFANVGINEVTESAGVAGMTLYNNFASKEALVLAVYEDLMATTLASIHQGTSKNEEERVLGLFSLFELKAEDRSVRGCPFIHASMQTSEPEGGIYALVSTYKQKLRQMIFEMLKPKRRNRSELADQLLLLLDGAAVEMYLQGLSNPGKSAKRAAMTLLQAV